ncbi:hypothetical protein Agabi119p4_9250 [Agaricus bisporus var. burnettii]|uniref:Uncharacterized protein n=1 Tax=Agaricus bisporus var. burnettii TaxID=192524 RepID=A0A8H7EY73_AGABI|nr:hypothetical protein Agabi119p4_9250 [Agaricus bisporus var. burnettii]
MNVAFQLITVNHLLAKYEYGSSISEQGAYARLQPLPRLPHKARLDRHCDTHGKKSGLHNSSDEHQFVQLAVTWSKSGMSIR